MGRGSESRSFAAVALLAIATLVVPGVAAAAPPVVKTVPWVATNALIPHDTWSGKSIRLKGTTNVQGAPWVYSWDFGDGTAPTAEATVTNQYALEASHAYTGAAGTIFTATLTVRNTSTGESGNAIYLVEIRDKTLEIEVNVAIDEGLWYLHKTMNRTPTCNGLPCGDWLSGGGVSSSGYYANTAANANAFEVNGHLEGGPASNPYTETVQRAMRRLFTLVTTTGIGSQTNPLGTFNPDVNGNGIGIVVNQGNPFYQGGMVMDAIVASGTPAKVTETGGANVIGRTYLDIVQDMVDYYSYCQYDSGAPAGGWRYSCNTHPDNSAAQWGAIGLIAAEDFGATVPQIVKDLNFANWLTYSRNTVSNPGSYGYTGADGGAWGLFATTPSAMVQLAMDGVGRGHVKWDAAETWLRDRFHNETGASSSLKDYYYGMFAFTKAMLLHDSNADGAPEPIVMFQSSTAGVDPIDWYGAERNMALPNSVNNTNGVARTLVNEQNALGYWSGHNFSGEQYEFETAWAIIMLNRTLFSGGAPVAVISANPNPAVAFQNILLNGGGSFHQDPGKSIVLWEWDLDNNGTFETTGVTANVSFPAVGNYIVRLRVTDNGSPAATDDATLTINVNTPPIAPTAEAGGPYNFCAIPGVKFFLNGAGSSNPDEGQSEPGMPPNTIVAYEWDLDNDGQFDDATGAQPDVTAQFPAPGSFLIQLRVTDNTAASYPSSGQPNLSDTDSAQVVVRSSTDPACVCSTLTARAKPSEVQLLWTAASGGAPGGYAIYRGTVAGGPYVKIAQVPAGQLGYLDRPLPNGTTQYYVIRPLALNGTESCQSNQASAMPRTTR